MNKCVVLTIGLLALLTVPVDFGAKHDDRRPGGFSGRGLTSANVVRTLSAHAEAATSADQTDSGRAAMSRIPTIAEQFGEQGEQSEAPESEQPVPSSDGPPAEMLLTPDVIIDVGHGGIDSGTMFGPLYEKKINLEIARLTYDLLVKKGIHPVLNRTDDRALSDDNQWLKIRSRHQRDLAQRKQLSNDLQPKLMISLHVNWSKDASQRGPVVLYQKNERSKLLAIYIQHSLNQLYRTSKKPVYGKTYYLLNHADCPTVIVEMGFISNSSDREQLTAPRKQKEIAAAICSAIEEYLIIEPLTSQSAEFNGRSG